jgi:predicted esterase
MGLVVALMGMPAAAQAPPPPAPPTAPPGRPVAPSPEAMELDKQMSQAYHNQEYAKALELGEKLLKLRPDDPAICYNMGCISNLMGNKPAALQWLRRSADHGFSNVEAISFDRDLRSLKGDPAFVEVEALVLKNAGPGIASVKERIAKSKPLIVVPPTLVTKNRVPVIVALHGFGQREDLIVESVREAASASGVIVVAPRGPRSAREGYAWHGTLEASMIVDDAIERVAATYNIDRDRIILLGFSQGGFVALNLGMRYPDRYAGIIAIGARYDPAVVRAPDEPQAKMPRFFLMCGADDPVLEECRRVTAALEAIKATVKLEVYPGLGHGFPLNREAELIKAIDFALDR